MRSAGQSPDYEPEIAEAAEGEGIDKQSRDSLIEAFEGQARRSRHTSRRSSQATFEITIRGELSQDWSVWFAGMAITKYDKGETRISGELPDQSALHGVLDRIRDLNLELVAIRKLAPGESKS